MTPFEEAAERAVAGIGAVGLRTLAERIDESWPEDAILNGASVQFAEAARPILAARRATGVAPAEAAAFLRGLGAGYARHAASVGVETVWSGPSSHSVPVRATAQVLIELIAEATSELILMTYSAKPHEPLLDALRSALARGVRVGAVVETLQGAGSALAGAEPAAAFGSVAGIELWHWPVTQRTETGSKLHAKLAVADRRVLLVSSANLTQSGVGKNIEAGLLVRGGSAPQRAAEHIAELQSRGVLARLQAHHAGRLS